MVNLLNKSYKFLFFTFLSCFLVSCSNNNQVSSPKTPKEKVIATSKKQKKVQSTTIKFEDYKSDKFNVKNIDGILFLFEKNRKYILETSGLNYKIIEANDSKIVLEIYTLDNKKENRVYIKNNGIFKLEN